jgi:hypothetical protein
LDYDELRNISSIITIDNLNAYIHKASVPAVAQQVVDGVNAYIESKTGRCWGETKTVTGYLRLVPRGRRVESARIQESN